MNHVVLMGRVCADPELRSNQAGVPVANYRLAVDRPNRRSDGQREADFFSCVAWDKRAEFAARYLLRGTKVAVEGHLQTRSWEAEDGSKRHAVEIVVEKQHFCESKKDTQPSKPENDGFVQVEDDDMPF